MNSIDERNQVVVVTTDDASSALPEILTVAEAAKLLRIGRNTCYEMARLKKIPSIVLGRRVLVPKRALMKLLGCEGWAS